MEREDPAASASGILAGEGVNMCDADVAFLTFLDMSEAARDGR